MLSVWQWLSQNSRYGNVLASSWDSFSSSVATSYKLQPVFIVTAIPSNSNKLIFALNWSYKMWIWHLYYRFIFFIMQYAYTSMMLLLFSVHALWIICLLILRKYLPIWQYLVALLHKSIHSIQVPLFFLWHYLNFKIA